MAPMFAPSTVHPTTLLFLRHVELVRKLKAECTRHSLFPILQQIMSLQKGKETTTAFSSLNHTAMKSMAGSEFIKKIKTWEILENILSAPALYGIPTDALEK
jgi:hypothetical protein